MDQRRPSRPTRVSLATVLLVLLVPLGPVVAQEAASPSPTPVIAAASMPPLAPGAVAVPFSVAPVDVAKPALSLLARWQSCGHGTAEPEAALARLTEYETEVVIRIDVETSPTGELCEAGTLVRPPVALEAPLGGRRLRDAGHPGREPIINLVDPIDTGLRYACGYYPSEESYSVAELLGPGLEFEAGILPSMAPDRRVVRRGGDEIWVLGPLQPKGWVQEDVWRLRGDEWVRGLELYDRRCLLRAQLIENIATATWRLRGRRPTARSRTIAIWVQETICNGRQLYGRVAQPIVQVRPMPSSSSPARCATSRRHWASASRIPKRTSDPIRAASKLAVAATPSSTARASARLPTSSPCTDASVGEPSSMAARSRPGRSVRRPPSGRDPRGASEPGPRFLPPCGAGSLEPGRMLSRG